MKTVKKAAALLVALVFVLLCTGCVDNAVTATSSVWLISKSTETEFWLAVFAGANAAKSEYNVDITICGPETEEDYEAQNAYIAQAVESGADAIIFSAISYIENAEAITAAARQGVKIVVIDSDVDSDGVSVRIGIDNQEAGRMAGDAVLDTEASRFVVGIVNYAVDAQNGQDREAGVRDALSKDERVEKIYTINVVTNAEEARIATQSLLAEHPDINAIVALNEPLAVGAAQAVDALQGSRDIKVIGFDTNVKCIDLMQSGVVTAQVVQNPYAMGYLGVENAYKLLKGERYIESQIFTPTVLVTQENMFTLEHQKALFPFGG